MADRDGDRLKGSIKGDAARPERLAAELRRNLRRRKDRARPAAAPPLDLPDQPGPAAVEACGEEARGANVAPIVAVLPICDSNTKDM